MASFWILSFELQDMCTLWISSNGFWRFPKTWGDFFFKYIDRFEIFMDYSHWSLLKLVVFCCDISWFNSLYWIYSVCHSGTFDTNSFHFQRFPQGSTQLSNCRIVCPRVGSLLCLTNPICICRKWIRSQPIYRHLVELEIWKEFGSKVSLWSIAPLSICTLHVASSSWNDSSMPFCTFALV